MPVLGRNSLTTSDRARRDDDDNGPQRTRASARPHELEPGHQRRLERSELRKLSPELGVCLSRIEDPTLLAPRQAGALRTGQNLAVPDNGGGHDPRAGGVVVTVADANPAHRDTAPTSEPSTGARGAVRLAVRSVRSPAIRVLGIYAAVRIVLLVADVLSAHVSYGSNLSGPLHSWDSSWYLTIAVHGYPPVAPRVGGGLTYSAAGFMPVFPALIHFFTLFGLSAVVSGLVVSILGGGAATLIVLRLGTVLVNQPTGWNAAVLFTLFPGMAISWGLLYCECVGLAFTAASLLLMVRKRWIWAGILGAFATATSPLALPLALGAAVPAVQALRNREPPRALYAVFLVPTGFVAFLVFLSARYHDVFFWWHLQHQGWGVSVDYGRSLLGLLPHLWRIGFQGPAWLDWTGLVFVAAGGFALWRAKLPACVRAYCLGVVLVLFASNNLGFKPRLLTWTFPALVAVAKVVRPRTWTAVVVAFASLLPLVFLAYTMLGNSMAQP